MASHVEHPQRKKAILKRAAAVFASEGYSGTTFQKIADACGISRTILYLYYPNKQAIFRGAVRSVIDAMAQKLARAAVSSIPAHERIEAAMNCLLDCFAANADIMRVTHEYLVQLARDTGEGRPNFRFRAQTATARRLLRKLVADGVRDGQLRRDCDPIAIEGILFAILETAGLRIALLHETGNNDLRASVHELVSHIAASK